MYLHKILYFIDYYRSKNRCISSHCAYRDQGAAYKSTNHCLSTAKQRT